MKYKLFVILIFVFCSNLSVAQQEEFPLGSPYSIFGIGEIQYSTNLRTDAMGIQGISLYGNYANNINPAANTRLSFTNFSVCFKYSFLKSTDALKSSSSSYGNVYGINIGIPFNQNNGWVLNLGFNPLSQINYQIKNIGNFNGTNYSNIYAGKGGISRVNFGMSYKIFHHISSGFEYNYSFGNINKLSLLDFNDPNYQNTIIRKENNLSGSYFKGGLVFDIGKIFKIKEIDNLTLGAVYQSPLKLNSTLDAIYKSSTGTDTVTTENGNIEIPQAFGVGLTNKFGERLIASCDFFYQQWSNYTEGGLYSGNLQNSYRLGLGFSILPSNKKEHGFLESIEYRFGFFFDNSYFKINNEQINRYGIGLGFGIPLNRSNSIDIGFNYYMRGKTETGFIKENLFKITAGINFGELWFIKSREE